MPGFPGRLGGAGAAGDHVPYAVQVIQIIQDHDLYIQDHGLLFPDLLPGLFKQLGELHPGHLPGPVELLLLGGRIAAGAGQLLPLTAVYVCRANGHTGEHGPAGSFVHA